MGKKDKGKHKGKGHDQVHRGRLMPTAAPDTFESSRPLAATELAAELVSLGAQLQRLMGRHDDSDGLTRARLSALGRLALGGPRRLGELAAAEGVRPPTMTRLVQSMEAEGMVERRPDPRDGRSVVVRATPAGTRLVGDAQAVRMAPLASAIGKLDADERAQLERASSLVGRLMVDVVAARTRP